MAGMKRIAALVPVLTVATLGGCVAPPARPVEQPPAQRPTMTPQPPAAPAAVADGAVASGIWTYAMDARGSRALFGPVGADALLVIRCDRQARRIYLSVPGTTGTLTLRATSSTRAYAGRSTTGTPPYVAADLSPADPMLDALAFSRGRFTVALDSRATTVPAWPEFTRVVEDCRA